MKPDRESPGINRTPPHVLALDLKGTLISDALSRIPRPDLFNFLCRSAELFPRIVVFTAVNEAGFRKIAHALVTEGFAPLWFEEIEHVLWRGGAKDISLIPGVEPANALLVDDFLEVAHPDQISRLVKIDHFAHPYLESDTGLSNIISELEVRVGSDQGNGG